MRKRNIVIATCAVLLLPVLILGILHCCGKTTFCNTEFWLAYMSFFGTIMVAGVSLLQNIILHHENQQLEKRLEEERYLKENLTSEHPILEIASVYSYRAYGYKRMSTYRKIPWHDIYEGYNLDEGLEIELRNIGNGDVLYFNYRFVNRDQSADAGHILKKGESQSIRLGERFIKSKSSHDIVLRYSNVRGCKYEQILSIEILEDNHEIVTEDGVIPGDGTISYTYCVELKQKQEIVS